MYVYPFQLGWFPPPPELPVDFGPLLGRPRLYPPILGARPSTSLRSWPLASRGMTVTSYQMSTGWGTPVIVQSCSLVDISMVFPGAAPGPLRRWYARFIPLSVRLCILWMILFCLYVEDSI